MDIQKLQQFLRDFAAERNWEKFHNPKNLSMAMMVEAGELLEIFQWLTNEESKLASLGPENYQAAKEEMADIFIYLIRLADKLDIDLEKAFWEKMDKNCAKYHLGSEKNKFKNK